MGEQAPTGPSLAALVAALADNKYFLGRRYAEWCTAAPTLESAVAAAGMAQDEVGHARSFYPLLKDVAGASSETEPESRTMFVNAPFLNNAFAGWTDFVAANVVFDTALTVLLEASVQSSFQPLAQRARRILEEEPLHWLHGAGWARRLLAMGGAVREALANSCARVGPQSLDWFEVANADLLACGVLDAGPGVLRARLRGRVEPILDEGGLTRL